MALQSCPSVGATSLHLIHGADYGATKRQFLQGGCQSGQGYLSGSLVGRQISCGQQRSNGKRPASGPLGARATISNIPKQFCQENLKDGLMENFKNVPASMYGLTPSQMDMFTTEHSPVMQQAKRMTPEAISSANAYSEGTGLLSLESVQSGRSRISMSANVSMSRGGGGGEYGVRSAPPDLPSLLLDARICYLGMPIVPEVTELIIAELLWLDHDNPNKPIYFYINSSGTQNEKRESIAFETEAYAIADTLAYVRPKIYTVNCGMAYGQAAMLLAIGDKGCRQVQPNSITLLYSPKVHDSSGTATDMWIKAKELDSNTKYYVELLAKGTGKSEEEIARDIRRTNYFHAQDCLDYGLADKIIEPRAELMERKNYEELLTQSRAAQSQAGRRGPESAPVGGGAGRR